MALYNVQTEEQKENPELLAGGTLYADSPIGAILPFGGATAPSGWFLCQGQAISRTKYSELFEIIGESFGAGDGSTTFNLPDMRESVPKGAGLTGKSVGAHLDADGLAVGEFLDDRFQGHEHSAYANNSVAIFTSPGGSGMDERTSRNTSGIVDDGSNGTPRVGATTEVKSVGVNYIIKARQIALPADMQALVADAFDSLINTGDNPPFVQDTTILDYIKGLDSDVSFVTFAIAQSSPNVTDKPANKGFYYFGHKVGTSWQIIAMSTDKRRCYMTNFNISASEISWMELMTRDSFKWSKLGRYELAKTEYQDIDVASYSEFLVQFGDKNSSQPYGGMTYIDTITDDHSNPSFIPMYLDDGYKGCAYIYHYTGTLRIKNASRDATLLFYVYVR